MEGNSSTLTDFEYEWQGSEHGDNPASIVSNLMGSEEAMSTLTKDLIGAKKCEEVYVLMKKKQLSPTMIAHNNQLGRNFPITSESKPAPVTVLFRIMYTTKLRGIEANPKPNSGIASGKQPAEPTR